MYGRNSGMQIGPPITPPIVKNLLIANAVVFVLQAVMPLTALGSVVPYLVVQEGYLWQPFTYMWLHGSLGHILMNLFVLWMFGSPLAMAWGPQRFLRYYLICGVGAGVLIAVVPYALYAIGAAPEYALTYRTLGASGAVYGLLLAYSLTWPDRTIMLIFPPIAFRAIWLIPALFLMSAMFPAGNVSHVGHLGGVAVGWLYLRSRGDTGRLFTIEGLKYKWRRHRMRQKLRSVQYEELEQRRREQDDRRLH